MYIYIYLCVINLLKIASLFSGKKFRKKVTNIYLNILNYLESTSLHLASLNGNQSVVELLLDRGSNIYKKNNRREFIIFKYLSIN